jgi:hypothetical protein
MRVGDREPHVDSDVCFRSGTKRVLHIFAPAVGVVGAGDATGHFVTDAETEKFVQLRSVNADEIDGDVPHSQKAKDTVD